MGKMHISINDEARHEIIKWHDELLEISKKREGEAVRLLVDIFGANRHSIDMDFIHETIMGELANCSMNGKEPIPIIDKVEWWLVNIKPSYLGMED